MVEVKNIILGIVIAVIFSMFLVYGAKLIYDNPEYEDFCNESYSYPARIPLDKECVLGSELQVISDDCYKSRGVPRYEYGSDGCANSMTCDFCPKEFEDAEKSYTKNMFVISLIIGLVIIIVSVLFIKVTSVSGGLMLGSLFFMLYGTAGYWRFMEGILRFVILGATLFVLIWLAYKITRKKINLGIKKRKGKKRR